jgi:hypothetical protein
MFWKLHSCYWNRVYETKRCLTTKNGVFWDVTPRGSCKKRRFGGTYASIIRVTRIGEPGTTLALTSNRRPLRSVHAGFEQSVSGVCQWALLFCSTNIRYRDLTLSYSTEASFLPFLLSRDSDFLFGASTRWHLVSNITNCLRAQRPWGRYSGHSRVQKFRLCTS